MTDMAFSNPGLLPWIIGSAFVVGMVIGSFLNVMGLRLLKDMSIVHPPSHCPHCETSLRPIDNIPVLSYILLQGRCHQCQAAISIQYPLVELATGLLFAFVVWQFGFGVHTLFLLYLVANLVVITITDARESLIFHVNSLYLIPAGLIYNLLNLGNHSSGVLAFPFGSWELGIPHIFISAIIAILIVFLFFEGMILLTQLLFGTDGFGHGDTHLMMGVGAYLGWELTVLALLLGFLLQALPAIPMLVYQWFQNKDYYSIATGGVTLIFALLPFVIMNVVENLNLQWILTLLSVVITLVALVLFFRRLKTSQQFTYLPLGPALVLGTLVALFFGTELIENYLQLIGVAA